MGETNRAFLEIRDGQGQSQRVVLQGSRMVVGRAADAGVRLESATISRQHAEMFRDPFGRWWVRDLKSRNGTRVNGRTINDHQLIAGDAIQIEDFELVLRMPTLSGLHPPLKHATNLNFTEVADQVHGLQDLEPPKIAALQLSALTRFGSQLLSTEDEHERLQLLCRLMVSPEMRGTSALPLRVAAQGSAIQPQPLMEPCSAKHWRGQDLPYISTTLLKVVQESKSPAVASNVGVSGAVEMSLPSSVASMAAAACPLRIDESAMDVLYVTFPAEYGTAEWLALAALAVEHYQQAESAWIARRRSESQTVIEQELEHARKIQMRLVPLTIKIQGLDVSVGFEPCRWVGGDYVDVLKRPDGKVLLLIADVCGKGLQAALISSSLHSVVHTSAFQTQSMQDLMTRLNNYLCQTLPDESFVTMVGIMLDPATGEIECVNAGHPPAMIVESTGAARLLQAGANVPLGCLETTLVSQRDHIATGQILALYTDGLTELADETGQMLGQDRLADLIVNISKTDAAATAAVLCQSLREQLDTYQAHAMSQDDRTFLLARRMIIP